MALFILDGNQSAATLSTIVVSSAHIPAHTVVSLGAQAISDIASSVSGSVVSISNFPASQTTTFGAVTGSISVLNFPATQAISISSVTIGNSITISSVPPISGSVTLGAGNQQIGSVTASISGTIPISISSVTIGNFPASQSVTFSAVTGSVSVLNFPASQAVTFSAISVSNFPATQPVSLATLPALVASTAQIGSVTASISGTIPVSIASVTIGNSVAISSLPALVDGTAQIGSVTASISGTIPISISSVTIGNSITIGNFPATQPISISSVTIGNVVTISGTVTSNLGLMESVVATEGIASSSQFVKIGGHQDGANATAHIVHVSAGGALKVDGSGSIQPIAGSVTLGAGTAQIGSVTASISGTVPISISSVTVGNSLAISSLPAISGVVTANILTYDESSNAMGELRSYSIGSRGGALEIVGANIANAIVANGLPCVPVFGSVTIGNTVTIAGTVTANPTGTQTIAGSVTIGAGISQIGSVTASLAISSTVISSGSFTSLTSGTLIPANTARKMATVYNLGAGQLFVNAGTTATTLGGGFMVALSSGDFYECNYTTTTLSAIFATAGTASWVSH